MASQGQGKRSGGNRSPKGSGGQRRGPGPAKRGPGPARGGGQGRPKDVDPTQALRERLAKVLGRLPETQRKVLEYRMGLVDGHPHNLADTARELGLTMHEAKKVEERAFEHIREAIPIQHLQKFLGGS